MFEFIKKKGFQSLVPIILVFLLALFLRLVWLDRVPGAVSGDELNYILPAKSVALSGEDLSFHWNLFQSILFKYPTVLPQAELPYFLIFPAVALLPLGLFTTTLPFAIVSAGTAAAMYLFVRQLFGNRAAIVAGILTAINPWQIFLGRTAYDMIPSPFFFLLGLYFLIREKGPRILIALPFLILAFYSYIGTKTVLIPIVVAASLFAYFVNKRKFLKQYLILNSVCILLIGIFALSLLGGAGRAGELALPTDPAIAAQVDGFRKASLAPDLLKNIFDNKFTIFTKIMLTKTANAFSPEHLFISSDNFTALYGHGLFYFVDALFLIIGFGFMYAAKNKTFLFIGSLILISAIPHVIHTVKTEVFTPHLALFFTLLIIPVAVGLAHVINFKNKILPVLIIAIYALSFSRFLYIYFFQYPLYGHFDFPARVVAKYASLAAGQGTKVDLYVSGTHDFYKKYIFYTDTFNRENFDEIKTSTNSHKYTLGNISFIPCGDIAEKFDEKAVSVYHSVLCGEFPTGTHSAKISRLDDGGEIYRIYNDNVCSTFDLKAYPSGLKITDFSVESLSAQKFCEAFIVR
jgi:4-amino-4-deoxy-L-arabinose transferase-like glycosyltransferase